MGLVEEEGWGFNAPAERSTGFFQKETPSHAPPSQSPPISSSFSSFSFFHTAMPSGHWLIVGKKQQLNRQENTL